MAAASRNRFGVRKIPPMTASSASRLWGDITKPGSVWGGSISGSDIAFFAIKNPLDLLMFLQTLQGLKIYWTWCKLDFQCEGVFAFGREGGLGGSNPSRI
jgi:hypothetical protein